MLTHPCRMPIMPSVATATRGITTQRKRRDDGDDNDDGGAGAAVIAATAATLGAIAVGSIVF